MCSAKHRKKAIICNNTGIIYESIVIASKELHCDRKAIINVLKHRKKDVKGLSFSYYNKQR